MKRDEELLAFPLAEGTLQAAVLLHPADDTATEGTLVLRVVPPEAVNSSSIPRDTP